MKRAQTPRPDSRPHLTVSETPDDREFTPKVFFARTRTVRCEFKTKDGSSIAVVVGEGDWEHRKVFFSITADGPEISGHEVCGFTTLAEFDKFIRALELARERARELGLLTFRPVPRRVKWTEG